MLMSALVFGLPHGACDFWILQQTMRTQNQGLGSLFSLLSVYLFLALATVAVWYFSPALALSGFLILTAWHFGSGDAVWESQPDWLPSSLGRGLLVLASPLVFHSQASTAVLLGLTGKTGVQTVEILAQLAPTFLLAGIVLLIIGCRRKLFSLFLLENIWLLLFFWLTSPLLAVTFYLIGVHSWRHLLRLNVYEMHEKPFSLNNVWTLIGNYHRRALPFTLLSLIGSLSIILIWQIRLSHLLEWTSAYLVLLSALTVPHAALISWTELRRKQQSFVGLG